MTPDEFKALRRALAGTMPTGRLSQEDLARLLRIADSRAVRRWEAGEREISGPVQVAMNYLTQGALDETMKLLVPEFVIGEDPEGMRPAFDTGDGEPMEILIRLWRPRFLALLLEGAPAAKGSFWAAAHAEGSLIGIDHLDLADGRTLVVMQWIDEPAGFDAAGLLHRAARAIGAPPGQLATLAIFLRDSGFLVSEIRPSDGIILLSDDPPVSAIVLDDPEAQEWDYLFEGAALKVSPEGVGTDAAKRAKHELMRRLAEADLKSDGALFGRLGREVCDDWRDILVP